MFLSKLLVPVSSRRATQNLTKLPKCWFIRNLADKGKSCPKAEVSSSVRAVSRCESGKCARMEEQKKCQMSKGAQVDCGVTRHAAEVFSRSLGKVRSEALTLQMFTRNSVNAIVSSMDLENSIRLKAERNRASQRLQSAMDKVETISRMNFGCGAAVKNKCYAIHEQIFASLQVWECENVSGEQSVRRRLEELECAVKERTDTAIAIIRTCKGCANPDNLMICVEASLNDANCILKLTNEHARNEIACVEQMKAQILQENADIMQQLMAAFERAIADLDKELNASIAHLKKLKNT